MEGEKELVLPSVGEERIGGAYTLGNESEAELLREMLTPTAGGAAPRLTAVKSSEFGEGKL